MTKLLEQAIAKLMTRSVNEQDSIATLILAELQDEEDLGFNPDRFQKSWRQAIIGETLPLSQLWEDIEVE